MMTDKTTLLDWALWYAEKGFAVFPCAGKKPRNTHGVLEATLDTSQIQAWWARWPNTNIGIACGPISSIFVLDTDPKYGGDVSLHALEKTYDELPDTPQTITGGGGSHFFFLHPNYPMENSVAKIGEGLDIRAKGGYVIAPPSAHDSGNAYEWELLHHIDEMQIAKAPDWLLDLIIAKQNEKPKEAYDDTSTIAEGLREITFMRMGGAMRAQGAGPAEIYVFFEKLNERTEPPLSDSALQRMANSLGTYPAGEAVPPRLNLGSKPTPGCPVFSGKTTEDIRTTYYPPPEWAIHGLLPEGATMLAGKPKQGKSFMAMEMACAIAYNIQCFESYVTNPGNVLYFALEDYAPRIQKRLLGMYPKLASSTYTVEWVFEAPKLGHGFLETLQKTLQDRPDFRLVVIDTLRCIRDGSKNAYDLYQEDSDMVGALNKLAQDLHISIIVVHHTRKAKSDDIFDTILATSGMRGATSQNMVVESFGRTEEMDAVLHAEGKDLEDPLQIAMKRIHPSGRWQALGDAERYKMGSTKRTIYDLLTQHGALTLTDMSQLSGLEFAAVKSMVYRLERNGDVARGDNKEYVWLDDRKGVDL